MAVPAHGPGQPLDPGYARKNGLTFSMCSTALVHGPGQFLDRFPVSPSPEHRAINNGHGIHGRTRKNKTTSFRHTTRRDPQERTASAMIFSIKIALGKRSYNNKMPRQERTLSAIFSHPAKIAHEMRSCKKRPEFIFPCSSVCFRGHFYHVIFFPCSSVDSVAILCWHPLSPGVDIRYFIRVLPWNAPYLAHPALIYSFFRVIPCASVAILCWHPPRAPLTVRKTHPTSHPALI